MNKTILRKLFLLFGILFLTSSVFAQKTHIDRTPPVLPNLSTGVSRGNLPTELYKLSPELRTLYSSYDTTRGAARNSSETGIGGFTRSQLEEIFGIKSSEQNPIITVSVAFLAAADEQAVKETGGSVISKADKTVYAMLPVRSLARLAKNANVQTINVFKAMQIPVKPEAATAPKFAPMPLPSRGGAPIVTPPTANQFDKKGLTGKGVIVGVIDSGIDWQHPDFKRSDGTSRILAIWDVGDNSYQTSNGAIGTKPPVYLEKSKSWLGTVYSNEQINAALKGEGKINSLDRSGHGTAVAGTAAGNGRATKTGFPSADLAGVAPDADLIVVKVMDCGNFFPMAELTAEWMTLIAQELKKPIVINMSFGGHFTAHDGTSDGEKLINALSGAGKPGVAFTVSAGNDGRKSLHATGKFGANREGQADNFSPGIDLFVREPSNILGVFNAKDDWAIALTSDNPIFIGADDKPIAVFLFKKGTDTGYKATKQPKNMKEFEEFISGVQMQLGGIKAATDLVSIQLPKGDYLMWGAGTSSNVADGKFSLYITDGAGTGKASFGTGAVKTGIIASPAGADNAITVGSYDFRTSWDNLEGKSTFYNLKIGEISDYSSMGFRRDGVIKPDIAAPARYTISPLSRHADPKLGGCRDSMAAGEMSNLLRDGYHIAWSGTSASSPFTAGVIALMLQKNPTLDAAQIKEILKKTAIKDAAVGAVPNPAWGWGKLNPAAAVAATPLPKAKTPVRRVKK